MMLFRAARYLKYILLSRHKRGHGIHSPFIFNLVTGVFRNKTEHTIVCTIESIREKLISDRRSINIKDLGSGSERQKTKVRKVSDIARYSAVPIKYGKLLSNLAAEFGKPLIIEFGTSFGISAMYMAASCPDTIVYTMEGCPEVSEIACRNIVNAGLSNIISLTGSFDDLLPGILGTGIKPGLVFIDGNHRKGPVLNYFSRIEEVSDSNTVVVIDDIYYSKEMEEAWNEIKLSEIVTVTVDLYRMGIVFFRRGISRNHYLIRY